MKKSYYHISDVKNRQSISKHGLTANKRGDIFLFSRKEMIDKKRGKRMSIADSIAMNQLFLNEYVLIQVHSTGITGELIRDNVAEKTAPYQFILKQRRIQAMFCKVIQVKVLDEEAINAVNTFIYTDDVLEEMKAYMKRLQNLD